ncbi:nucleotidyl transferase AbiEii/AbiGii toxin family protein [Candidatus Peregrinibacteria bacterium]|nr:nucleotidyl transferase AbiEii/AbiGii toxin family protein [Candidatus Peregrinibacteria bacterium]
MLDKHDIAVMKIIAISQRGRKRDFIDLYWYCANYSPLINLIKCLPSQYLNISRNYHHILKSLIYFCDAENDPMPKIFFKTSWKEVKNFFKQEVKRTARQLLRL